MSSKTVLVYCVDCAGTGMARGGIYQCGECMGQCHIALDRAPDGGVPDGYRLWREYTLPDLRHNPLILTSDVRPL
jgi:DnaJ-class molecular chaperone